MHIAEQLFEKSGVTSSAFAIEKDKALCTSREGYFAQETLMYKQSVSSCRLDEVDFCFCFFDFIQQEPDRYALLESEN